MPPQNLMLHSSFKIRVDSYEIQLDRQQILIKKFLYRWHIRSILIQKTDLKHITLTKTFGQLQLTLIYQNQSGKNKKIMISILQGDPKSLQFLAELKKIFPLENKIDSQFPQFDDTFSLPLIINTRGYGYCSRVMYLALSAKVFLPLFIYLYFSGSYRLNVNIDALSIREERSKKIPWDNILEVKIEMLNNDNRKSYLNIRENYVGFDILTKQNESFNFILSPLNANKLIPLFIKKRLLPKNLNLSEIGFIES